MLINNKLLGAGAILMAFLGAAGGVEIGCLHEAHQDQIEAVRPNVAHWNPRTAEFPWGSAESVNLVKSNTDDVMSPIDPVRPRKPKGK